MAGTITPTIRNANVGQMMSISLDCTADGAGAFGTYDPGFSNFPMQVQSIEIDFDGTTPPNL